MSASRKYRRQLAGHRTMFIRPDIPDDASVATKNGLAMRNEASATGSCPGCGAEVELSGPIIPGTVVHAVLRHDEGCPALLQGVL